MSAAKTAASVLLECGGRGGGLCLEIANHPHGEGGSWLATTTALGGIGATYGDGVHGDELMELVSEEAQAARHALSGHRAHGIG